MAMDNNRLIGKDGGMPWYISSDFIHFKKITMGKPLVMGRKTHESIGRPLPGRQNIVITGNKEWQADGVDVVHSLQAAFQLAGDADATEVMVIGGASICEEAMAYTQRLYLTIIDHEFEGGDTWLGSYEAAHWQEQSQEPHDETADGGYRFTYYVLERDKAAPALLL